MKAYGQKCVWVSPNKWELSWYQDQLTGHKGGGEDFPEPVLHRRRTNAKGAERFCKKYSLEFIKDTHSGRRQETAKQRRRRYYLHSKLRRAGFKVDAYKRQIDITNVKLITPVSAEEIIAFGYNLQITLE